VRGLRVLTAAAGGLSAVLTVAFRFVRRAGWPPTDLLLGIGISCLVQTAGGEDYPVNLTMSLAVSIITLMLILVLSGVYIPLNGYGAARPYGIFLLVAFVISTVLSVVLTAMNCSLDGCN